MRADQLVVERGLASSRAQAQRLIKAGVHWRLPGHGDWRAVAKNGDDIPAHAELRALDDAEVRFVSRGGLKLEGALLATGIDVTGARCLDVGQSTGGFTDCLLQRGAAQVVGVDVGHGQLHPRLAADARVAAIEGVNARSLEPATVDPQSQGFALIVGDLSFISLTLVLPALARCMQARTELLLLVKPQFELQSHQLGKGGIVRDATLHAQVQAKLTDAVQQLGLTVRDWLDSSITGGDGNREFFLRAYRHPSLSTA